ncbi:LytTR family DNA-binding domain-containing protein [Rhizobium sp. Root1203]|uniref:LytTR family DNA-binding domain-containing protein n=1 Tax=Rhizobium sp. Root1203 TaxID=1736427 RepID=UPI000A81EA56
MQSTLRELQVFVRSPRFWATFAAVVLIFTVTGAYGTADRMHAGERLSYWLIVHAVAWGIAILCSVIADVLLRGRIENMLMRMMIGSIASALPIGIALGGIDFAFTGVWSEMDNTLHRALFAMPLCALFCLLTYMAMHQRIAEAAAPTATPSESAPATSIVDRLKPANRGPLLRLSVQDHYTEVVTGGGRELVLLRFADALREACGTPGLQVHRSHWIADAHVESVRRENGKLVILTRDGSRIPVSRSYTDDVRRRFG